MGYFGVKSAKVPQGQMGTKPAKVGRLAPGVLKVRRGPHPAPTGASTKRSSLCGASKVAKVGSGRGSNLLKSDRRGGVSQKGLRSTKRSSLRGRTKVAKVGPLRARVKSAKVRAPPYVYYPPRRREPGGRGAGRARARGRAVPVSMHRRDLGRDRTSKAARQSCTNCLGPTHRARAYTQPTTHPLTHDG